MSEFEEGEYRGPLFNQLEKGAHLLWEPGQVFEKKIGVDKASMCVHNYFWQLHREYSPRVGVYLNNGILDYIWKGKKKTKTLPDFSLNLFIQAKRSYYSSRRKAGLHNNGIPKEHWYFNITKHQQLALEELANALGDKAIVVYAAPVFHKQQQLYNHTQNQTIVENSTFPEVSKLAGHKTWYFDKPGASGIANPDFEFIEGEPLYERLQSKRQIFGNFSDDGFATNLINLANGINSFSNEQSEIKGQQSFQATRYAFYRGVIEDFLNVYDISEMKHVRAFMETATFSVINKFDWLTF